ncbi:alpha-tocopherol transfer protein [Galendromus occidentalis]|uniref:Alpha-tocopherol transfer protein n=1 Tax=Galendromus occidentalis TaxID=34638 RepID=A0AAJ6VWC3_9ACAR|nr:alpha-tocopherol transfer protein [Galendromus occidentalis]
MKSWSEIAAEELGETPEIRESSLRDLRALIRTQGRPSVNYEDDDEFLIRFLRTCKFNVDRSFRMVNNYYLNRASHSNKIMPKGKGPRDTEFYAKLQTLTVLKKKNHDGSTVVIFRKGGWEPSDGTAVHADMLFLGLYLLEWLTRDPEVQVTGISFVYDCDGFGIRHLPYVDLAVFQFLTSCINNSYPMRVRAIHVMNVPMPFRFVLNLVTRLLSQKVRERFHVHTDREALLGHIDPKILPLEYSKKSQCGTFDNRWMFEKLCERHNWFVERSFYGLQKSACDKELDVDVGKNAWFP